MHYKKNQKHKNQNGNENPQKKSVFFTRQKFGKRKKKHKIDLETHEHKI